MKGNTVQFLTRTAMLLALALVFQLGFNGFAQPLVGPLVNMTLLVSAGLVGTISGILVGCLTPVVALMVGIIKLPPLVPIIIVGNALLVIVFNLIKGKLSNTNDNLGWGTALVAAAIAKYAFLTLSVQYVLPLIIPKVPPKLIAMFGLSQLYTALLGGFIAVIIIKLINNTVLKNSRSGH